jgi:hypothetical protein
MHRSQAYITTNENPYDLSTRISSSESGYPEIFDLTSFFAEGGQDFVDLSVLRGQCTSSDMM